MDGFFSLLERRAKESGSLLCVGLDPHLNLLSDASAAAARDFCLRLVRETADYAAAFKPNAAFFEVFGAAGWTALQEVIAAIHAEAPAVPVILDAKRGDIASTAAAYAQSAFEHLRADSITLNPYLGQDAVAPFIQNPVKGVFLLCKTSNPGSADLQNLRVQSGAESLYLYEHVARLAQNWNAHDNIGLVVGATHPEALSRVRAAAPDLWFLSPGVGAQGGDLSAALRAGLRADGFGVLISASRSIARASRPGAAAAQLRDAIVQERRALGYH